MPACHRVGAMRPAAPLNLLLTVLLLSAATRTTDAGLQWVRGHLHAAWRAPSPRSVHRQRRALCRCSCVLRLPTLLTLRARAQAYAESYWSCAAVCEARGTYCDANALSISGDALTSMVYSYAGFGCGYSVPFFYLVRSPDFSCALACLPVPTIMQPGPV